MLTNSKAYSGFSVKDLKEAKDFYTNVIGVEVTENEMGVLELHLGGGLKVIAYPKPGHVPATFTVLNFPVADVEAAVAELKKAGVAFERYNEKDLKTDDDNIMRGHGMKIAWFTDPSGNILSIHNEK